MEDQLYINWEMICHILYEDLGNRKKLLNLFHSLMDELNLPQQRSALWHTAVWQRSAVQFIHPTLHLFSSLLKWKLPS